MLASDRSTVLQHLGPIEFLAILPARIHLIQTILAFNIRQTEKSNARFAIVPRTGASRQFQAFERRRWSASPQIACRPARGDR